MVKVSENPIGLRNRGTIETAVGCNETRAFFFDKQFFFVINSTFLKDFERRLLSFDTEFASNI